MQLQGVCKLIFAPGYQALLDYHDLQLEGRKQNSGCPTQCKFLREALRHGKKASDHIWKTRTLGLANNNGRSAKDRIAGQS